MRLELTQNYELAQIKSTIALKVNNVLNLV